MAELAEIEVLRRGIEQVTMGRIELAWATDPEVLGTNAEWKARLQGAQIEKVVRRGRHLVLYLEDAAHAQFHLVLHLTTGVEVLWQRASRVAFPPGGTRLYLGFPQGVLFYRDALHTGRVDFHTLWLDDPELRALGPDFDSESCDLNHLLIETRRVPPETGAAAFLLDQRRVAGLGPYLVSEILYGANIAPTTPVLGLSVLDWQRVLSYGKSLVNLLVAFQGAGITGFQPISGPAPRGNSLLRVYHQDRCPKGHTVLDTATGGYLLSWCPICQA